jgi:hypothetical protein
VVTGNGLVPTQEIEGVVQATNAKGLKLGGAWLNVSQYHPVELPDVGAHVRLKIDARGYIKELETMSQPAQSPAVLSDRDERITRLAVLKAAAEFGASRPDLKSGDVLTIADRWLEWVNQ